MTECRVCKGDGVCVRCDGLGEYPETEAITGRVNYCNKCDGDGTCVSCDGTGRE